MEANETRLIEHLAVNCPLALRELCELMQRQFELPGFAFDFENETEWGFVVRDGIEYNITRPFKTGTLKELDNSVPVGSNFGVLLIISIYCPTYQDAEWSVANLVPPIAQGLADLVVHSVYHHRTWLKVGDNVIRNQIFWPNVNPGVSS